MTTQIDQQRMEIVDGPGKFDLMVALFDGKVVRFTLKDKNTKALKIIGVELEDGSNQRWLIKGYIYKGYHMSEGDKTSRFSGYYDSYSRKGWLEIVEKSS